MKTLLIIITAVSFSLGSAAQGKFFTRDGHIKFFSSTPVEDIEADNNKVTAVLDGATGKLEFAAVVKSFEFEKALMEEHFNENYMESKTFPKATFKGNIKDFNAGSYGSESSVVAVGEMTIHGVTKKIEAPGTIVKTDAGYELKSKMMIEPEEYGVDIPNTVRDNIAQAMEVTVDCTLVPLKK